MVEEKQESQRRPKPEQEKKQAVNFSYATPAKVEEIIERTGTRGEAIQVRCRILDGRDKNKILRRNVRGPIQVNDILMLRETEIEARRLKKSGRGLG
jgi:small subunit ribosomal protein S28e